jgi:hypothetical protein
MHQDFLRLTYFIRGQGVRISLRISPFFQGSLCPVCVGRGERGESRGESEGRGVALGPMGYLPTQTHCILHMAPRQNFGIVNAMLGDERTPTGRTRYRAQVRAEREFSHEAVQGSPACIGSYRDSGYPSLWEHTDNRDGGGGERVIKGDAHTLPCLPCHHGGHVTGGH